MYSLDGLTSFVNLITVDDMGWIRILDPQEFDDANKLRHTSKTLQQGLFAYSIGVIILMVTDFGTLLKESKELLMIMKKRADIVEAQKKRVIGIRHALRMEPRLRKQKAEQLEDELLEKQQESKRLSDILESLDKVIDEQQDQLDMLHSR
ncbi:hypothetical protein MP638_006374 [Amoeboaphelidium occidentale]|nr:hypothetical protein MP638_006374 [Amoeboaphelidium occidentale]